MVLICREGNPLLSLEVTERLSTTLRMYFCYRKSKIQRSAAESSRNVSGPANQFHHYNILTIAALVANSDMLAIIPAVFITCLAAAGRWKNCLFRLK